MRKLSRGERKRLNAGELAKLCAQLADEYKAERILVLNVSGICTYTDFLVICSGRSTRQVQGIADHIEEMIKKSVGTVPLGIEGWREGLWILMDYEDVIVHIFYNPIREVYDLESLWADAEMVHIEGVTALAK
ncbi:MAG: ribosome silencing factor [Deltaproteobacteria bacterium]|nr:ribosome silencing factor [Deltaproteobacteria bacterium]MBW2067958.1 ribosome silencing factor [Deltaproteobacteria bacterium]